ncbi:hypothetical protein P8452_63445 [Trifolium repens]|nr:hypothetical protein P8452_63445 [Trifolium repens]
MATVDSFVDSIRFKPSFRRDSELPYGMNGAVMYELPLSEGVSASFQSIRSDSINLLENLIGKGGSNRVYKGVLPAGKPIAVKVLKSSKEAWKDFAFEVE